MIIYQATQLLETNQDGEFHHYGMFDVIKKEEHENEINKLKGDIINLDLSLDHSYKENDQLSDSFEKLKAENKHLVSLLNTTEKELGETLNTQLQGANFQLKAENGKLKEELESLKPYLKHHFLCMKNRGSNGCSCGLDEVVRG